MNSIRSTQALNARELAAGVAPSASWHRDFSDTAFIYIGGLPFTLSEGDIVTIFSQFGEPVFVNLVRDKETGKSKGFAFLKYEDQRSTDLAVDNLGGATVMGRVLRVDHTRYKKKDEEEIVDNTGPVAGGGDRDGREEMGEGREKQRERSDSPAPARPLLKEEVELAKLLRDHDDDDPMKDYLVQEKRDQVAAAIADYESTYKSRKGDKDKENHKHRHRHSHRQHTSHQHRSEEPGSADADARRRRHRSRERSLPSDAEDRDRRRRRKDDQEKPRMRPHSRSRSVERSPRRRGYSRERRRGR